MTDPKSAGDGGEVKRCELCGKGHGWDQNSLGEVLMRMR